MSNPEEDYDFKTFRILVQAMREKQRVYFAFKNKTDLEHAKKMEQRVDNFLRDYKPKT